MKRSHKNTSRLTAKERVADLVKKMKRGDFGGETFVGASSAFDYVLFAAVVQGSYADHAALTLERNDRRATNETD